MGEFDSLLEESRQLADAMFDSRLDAKGIARLEELLANDWGCLQAYVEQLNFHIDLQRRFVEEAPLTQAASAIENYCDRAEARERRENRGYFALLVTSLFALVGGMGWFISARDSAPPEVGIVTGLSADIERGTAPLELGQILREGQTFTVSAGTASIELPNLRLNVLAPAQVRFVNARNVELLSGTVHALVQRGGEGFTVRTPDAVIVDLGTEFTVSYYPEGQTEVQVRRGLVEASLLERNGLQVKRHNITAGRAVNFSRAQNITREVNFRSAPFDLVDRTRGVVKSIDGTMRTLPAVPTSLASGSQRTRNHMVVIPEQQQILLKEPLELSGWNGPVVLPAGSRLNSYLIHYNPDRLATTAPRGAVTFDGEIAAVLVNDAELTRTDARFGLPGVTYGEEHARGLELSEDQVRISDDLSTATFYFVVAGENAVDQVRILVHSQESSQK